MKKIILLSLMIIAMGASASASAKSSCELSQVGAVNVSWEAYKTASKAGVGGIFDSVKYTPIEKMGKNFSSILVGSTVSIDTTSVNTKNKGRDDTLVKFFFEQMSSKNIDAKIVDIKADKRIKDAPRTGVVTIDVTMNSVTKSVPMKYSFSKGLFTAKGVIDILDFSASKALNSINKACYDLHAGKTWSDVAISFNTKIEAVLCNTKPLE
ncbi:YceI family protein [Sulfurimonas sp.]|uniref:YceI family protein n=1 Tax=Sulfurimonas sp. TaxID=2022749 RepID=UPI0026160D00|nr:YceI family protein [Sulfurimonas sp.]MCW8894967.1 YceI family protein [Sulfurimonas sp.]